MVLKFFPRVCPPVIATASLYKILNVIFTSASTHALIANAPECLYVPSPRFAKIWLPSIYFD